MVKNTWNQCRRPLLGTALAVVLGIGAPGASATAAGCPPWPGEPAPLPAGAHADPLRARWAELRLAELAQRARALENTSPLEANRLWQRLLCLGAAGARQGVERTRPVQVHRLEIVAAGDARAVAAADAWANLERPVAGAPQRPGSDRGAERTRLLRAVDHWLERLEDLVADARFDAALESADETRARLKQIRWDRDVDARWV